jgi:hypothetical protein
MCIYSRHSLCFIYKNCVSYYNAGIAEHYQTLHYNSFFIYHQLSFSSTFNLFVTCHKVAHHICVIQSTRGFESHLFKGPNVSIIKHLSVCIRVPLPGRVTTLFTLCFNFCFRAKEEVK